MLWLAAQPMHGSTRLVRSLSPGNIDFGKVPNSPVDHTVQLLEAILRSGKGK
jgi:hypothetical protein